jgi:hypothetical protein
MNRTACEGRHFPVPMRRRPAGGDLSRLNRADQPADRPLLLSTRHLDARCALPGSLRTAIPAPRDSITPSFITGAKIKSP